MHTVFTFNHSLSCKWNGIMSSLRVWMAERSLLAWYVYLNAVDTEKRITGSQSPLFVLVTPRVDLRTCWTPGVSLLDTFHIRVMLCSPHGEPLCCVPHCMRTVGESQAADHMYRQLWRHTQTACGARALPPAGISPSAQARVLKNQHGVSPKNQIYDQLVFLNKNVGLFFLLLLLLLIRFDIFLFLILFFIQFAFAL